MTAFKNVLCCLAATLTFISVSAQSVQDRFVSAAKNHCVEFSYSFVMHASAPVSGNGTAKVQGECFSVDGNGMKIMCDGRTRWIVDEKAREVIVESVTGDEESLAFGQWRTEMCRYLMANAGKVSAELVRLA